MESASVLKVVEEHVGNLERVAKLYSRPPYENVMLTVVDDPTGVHFAWMGGRCSPKIYDMNIIAAISACPDDQDAVNDGVPKALGVQILE